MKRLFLVIALCFGFFLPNFQFANADVLVVSQDKLTGYNRSLFKHWIDADKDGCDTRAEVLIQEAVVKPKIGKKCVLTGGKWLSSYDGKSTTKASDLDIDHLVPLAEAWRSGAWAWTPAQREAFANDLTEGRGLVAVTLGMNRSKGDKDVANWLPKVNACGYFESWIIVKEKYGLTVDSVEAKRLNVAIKECNLNSPLVGQDEFEASSDFAGNQNPDDGDEWVRSFVHCYVKSPAEYQAINSYVSIVDPFGNLLIRDRLSDIYKPFGIDRLTISAYSLNLNEMLKNSGKTYSCLFDFVRLDGSQVTKELPVKVPSIIKSPLPKPQTVIHSIGRGANYEVACFLTNWKDYSLGKFEVVDKETRRFVPTSKVTLLRDDGSIVRTASFTTHNPRYFFIIPWDLGNTPYLGLFLDQQEMYGEIGRAADKRYTCKYEMVGFKGETLVHTEIVQMPTRFITATPTPTPTPTVTPGAFCATAGAIGKSASGVLYTCKVSSTDTRYRWRP